MRKLLIGIVCLIGATALIASASASDIKTLMIELNKPIPECMEYDRKQWHFNAHRSPVNDSTHGYYTNTESDSTDVDHVVSLRDAHGSGASCWGPRLLKAFSNDATNHLPALPDVNRIAKNKYPPLRFFKNMDNKPKFSKYTFGKQERCKYIEVYVKTKIKYSLSFANNDLHFLLDMIRKCGIR